MEKTLNDSYIEYILLYDTIGNRISIRDVTEENGRLKLIESVYWEYDSLPHMLIAGGTGGGKTYFILTIIEAMLHTNANLYILDHKNVDLEDLETVMPNVYSRKEDMLSCIDKFYEEMIARSEEMKQHQPYSYERTLNWLRHQVAQTLKVASILDVLNESNVIPEIIREAKLTDKHEKLIEQQNLSAKDEKPANRKDVRAGLHLWY